MLGCSSNTEVVLLHNFLLSTNPIFLPFSAFVQLYRASAAEINEMHNFTPSRPVKV